MEKRKLQQQNSLPGETIGLKISPLELDFFSGFLSSSKAFVGKLERVGDDGWMVGVVDCCGGWLPSISVSSSPDCEARGKFWNKIDLNVIYISFFLMMILQKFRFVFEIFCCFGPRKRFTFNLFY